MTSVAFTIEHVTDLDAAWSDLVALFLAFEDYNHGFLQRRLRDDWQQRWRDHLVLGSDRLVLIARAGGEAIGYLVASVVRDQGLFDETYTQVSDLFVRASHRDGSVGRTLTGRAEVWSRDRGVHDLRLEVFSANKPGVRFWTYSGYGLDSMGMRKTLRVTS